MRIRILTILMAAALMVPGANAALTLYLSDGTNSVLLTDSTNSGAITYNGNLGGTSPWIVNVTTGLSKPILTNPSGDMDLNSVNVTSSAGGTLTIILADNGWPGGGGGVSLNIGGTLASGASLDAKAFVNNAGTLPTLATPLPSGSILAADTGLITPPPTAFAASVGGNAGPLTAGFTLIEEVVLHHTAGGSTSFDGSVTIPEPASLTLLGAALLASSKLLRKKLIRS
jgi:hypothetical protein